MGAPYNPFWFFGTFWRSCTYKKLTICEPFTFESKFMFLNEFYFQTIFFSMGVLLCSSRCYTICLWDHSCITSGYLTKYQINSWTHKLFLGNNLTIFTYCFSLTLMTDRFKGVTGADLLRCQFTLKLWECLLPLTLAGAPKRTSPPPPQGPLWELQGWP